jgi:ribosome maturation factor RimP
MNRLSKTEVEKIAEVAEALLQTEGMGLVDWQFRKEGRTWVLRIFIDKPGGVTLDDCADISRQLGDQIEVHDLIPHAYTLEVSSPGLDRPLKKDRDFLQSLGKVIQLNTHAPLEGQSFFRGVLTDYTPGGILRLEEKKKIWDIPVSTVAKARLVFEG